VTLGFGPCDEASIAGYAAAESAITIPSDRPLQYVDHHFAHAATAFWASPFSDATILVCDRSGEPELSVWRGSEQGIERDGFEWQGPALATLYSRAAEAMGLGRDGEARLEALARVGDRRHHAGIPTVVYRGDHLSIPANFEAAIAAAVGSNGASVSTAERARLAQQLQRHIGDLLLEIVESIPRQPPGAHLCLGGGLFYNSFYTTLLAESGLYASTFVPPNPGNAGVSVGAALAIATRGPRPHGQALSAFLGPEFSVQEVKATLDNCKLSYDYLRNGQLIDQATAALVKGKLVGWFQGRMEWGVRALGNRSILASPVAPYVLENLNVFLKHREPHRTYSVAICAEDRPKFFQGPSKSSFMEYEYEVLDRDLLRGLLPKNTVRLRVQTVEESDGLFYQLLRSFGAATGVPMLINTSFNGFNEPIVCHPRDAVRVFYGTGLDMAVLDGIVLQK
jgi:carbamoyltransferase